MTSPPQRFIDYSTLTPFPARPEVPRRRPAWLIGFMVAGGVMAGGTVLGPVALVVLFHLSPLHPITVVFGVGIGATAGLTVGVLLGAVTAAVVGLVRESRREVVAG